MIRYYILFESHEQAVALHAMLKGEGFRSVIAPTPRTASVCCGVSLMISEEEIEAVKAFLKEHPECVYKSVERVEQKFNTKRDKYC